MKCLVKIIALVLISTFIFFSFSCAPKGSVVDLFYFNSNVHIQTENTSISSETLNQIKTLLSNLENTFDTQKDGSLPTRFSTLSEGQSTSLNQTENKIFSLCKEYYQFTDGKFNPLIRPLLCLWQFTNNSTLTPFLPPTKEQIDSVINSGVMNFSSVEYLAEQNSLIKPCSDMQLDFGGIVKGFAADKIASILRENGHYAGYVNVGGSSMNLLKVNSLGIRHPRKDGKIIDVNLFDLENLSVSTSGDYEKYHDYQGKRYSHIINPFTGYPADTGICSATVICNDGAFADAITTALCLCSHQANSTNTELTNLINKILLKYPDAQIFVVFEKESQKQILTNKKQGEDFTLLDNQYTVVNL